MADEVITDGPNGRPVFTAGCGHVVQVLVGAGTGYARKPDGSTVCYACAYMEELAEFATATEYVAYVSGDGKSLTNWPGGILARITGHTVSRTGFNRSEVHRWWMTDPKGRNFYGSNGGPGMVVRVKRIKD